LDVVMEESTRFGRCQCSQQEEQK